MERNFMISYKLEGSKFTYLYSNMKAKNEKHAFMKFQNLCMKAGMRFKVTVVGIEQEGRL